MITALKRRTLHSKNSPAEPTTRATEPSAVMPDDSLPPLDLLDARLPDRPDEVAGSQETADRIAAQFRQRGIDASFVGTDVATRMVTYRFRLAETGFDQVARADDLLCRMVSMAAATSGVSIQAPIPDSAEIAVHLPRKEAGVIRLTPFVTEARRLGHRVPFCLGEDYLGLPHVADLATACHQLVAGQTGSGKSIFLSAGVLTLAMSVRPEDVRLVLIDGKGLDLTVFDRLPHNACPVITDPAQAVKALAWLNGEMDRRRRLIREQAAQDIWSLNDLQGSQGQAIPALVLMIDEFQAILAEPDADGLLKRLAQQGRACGIFVVLATQRPSVDILQGSTKTNVPGRVCFRLPSQVDSRVVLDQGGAEQLVRPGDLLAIQSSIGKPVRLQAPLPSAGEVKRIGEFFADDRPCHLPDLVQAVDGGTSSSLTRLYSTACYEGDDRGDDELFTPSIFVPVRVDEKTVLRKLRREFPGRDWSVQLVYRPMLLAETERKALLLYDFTSRSLVTHLAPWRAVGISHLLACTAEELQVLAALRRMPRKLRSLIEITAWLGTQGHPDANILDPMVQGLVSPNYRLNGAFQSVPALAESVSPSPIPADSVTIQPVRVREADQAKLDLRRVLTLLWGAPLDSARLVGLPVWSTQAPARMNLPAATSWRWQLPSPMIGT